MVASAFVPGVPLKISMMSFKTSIWRGFEGDGRRTFGDPNTAPGGRQSKRAKV